MARSKPMLQTATRKYVAIIPRLSAKNGDFCSCNRIGCAALVLAGKIPRWRRVTLGADEGYDRGEFVRELRDWQVTPNIARKRDKGTGQIRVILHAREPFMASVQAGLEIGARRSG
jgi:hypothetical protein